MENTQSRVGTSDLLGCPQPERDNVTDAEHPTWRLMTLDEVKQQFEIARREYEKARGHMEHWQAIYRGMTK